MSDLVLQICRWALELNCSYALPLLDKKYLKGKQTVRDLCLVNACGKSGSCWSCPPYVGELNDLTDEMFTFNQIVVIQNIAPLEDSWDFEGMQAAEKRHNDNIREIRSRLRAKIGTDNVLALGCGGCGYCEKCTCPGEPCKFPEEALSSIEGYGVDVKALVESIGLQYINGVNTVSYVGVVLIK